MLPRQPSNVPMTEPTMRPPTSATRTWAGLEVTARRRSLAVSVTPGVASACRHSSRTLCISSSRHARMDRLPAAVSFIVVPIKEGKPAAGAACHGPLHVSSNQKASVEEGHVPHGPGLPLGVHDDLV